jgi:hypothetical protein
MDNSSQNMTIYERITSWYFGVDGLFKSQPTIAQEGMLEVFKMADTNEGLSDFGLSFIKVEGGAVHPDDTEADYSDERYIKQFNAYLKSTGLSKDNTLCSRPELLERIG